MRTKCHVLNHSLPHWHRSTEMWTPELSTPWALLHHHRAGGMGAGGEVWENMSYCSTWVCDVFLLCIRDGRTLTLPYSLLLPNEFRVCSRDWADGTEDEGLLSLPGQVSNGPGGCFGTCPWTVGTDHLWGGERGLSEGPVRSSPSFVLLFPVQFCFWGRHSVGGVAGYSSPLWVSVLSSMKNIWREEEESEGCDSIMAEDQSCVWTRKVMGYFCYFYWGIINIDEF